jgi:hypothetical protein
MPKFAFLTIIFLCVAGLLSACGSDTAPLIASSVPTNTQEATAEPSPTITQSPTEVAFVPAGPTDTPRATVAPRSNESPTVGPSPTSPLGATFTPAPATLTATAEPTQVGLSIEFFAPENDTVAPGDNVILFWRVLGSERVSIFQLGEDDERQREWRVNSGGQLTVNVQLPEVSLDEVDEGTIPEVDTPVDEDAQPSVRFLLVAEAGNAVDEWEISITLSCSTDGWFFSPPAEGCPAEPQIPLAQVEQRFENGLMVWQQLEAETPGQIFVIFDDTESPQWLRVTDNFQDGQPERDESLSPPAPNLLQPVRGFGLAWRSNPEIQRRLGWATESEFPSNGIIQSETQGDGVGTIYLSTSARGILELRPGGTSWTSRPDVAPVTPTPDVTSTPTLPA